MHTGWVNLSVDGSTMPSYTVKPDGHEKRAGIIIIEEIFGVNKDIQKLTELAASAGYDAIAPNVFHRTDPHLDAPHDESGFKMGLAAASATTLDSLTNDVLAAAKWLREQPESNGNVAIWGFCFGGSTAFLGATIPGIDAAVSFYGGQIAKRGDQPGFITEAHAIHAPIFFAYGGKDPYIPAADIELVKTTLDQHGKSYSLNVYPDEDHGFFREGPTGNAGSADVWPKVQAFLASHLQTAAV